ncbi:MAG: type VI secretion system tip protein TssI/VgrG [Polyangiaceae bacterium]
MDEAQLVLDGLDGATIVSVRGREAINELSEFTVDLLHPDPDLDVSGLVDKDAVLSLRDPAGAFAHLNLVVFEASHRGHFRGLERYRFTLRSPAARLELRINHEIFQDKTTQEIVTALLERVGFPSKQFKWRLAAQYAKRVYTVQFGESDWSFVSRLLADEGINFWFDQDGEESVLVFGDDPSSHDSIAGDTAALPLLDASGLAIASFAVHSMDRTWRLAPTAYFLRDIDVEKPDDPIDAKEGDGGLEIYEYPSNLILPDAAKARVKVRLQQARRREMTAAVGSSNANLRPGRIVSIVDAADEWHNGKFLVTAVEHDVEQAGQEGQAGAGVQAPYRNRVELVPMRDEVPCRPAAPVLSTHGVRRPVVEGLDNAVVTGPGGEEIHVDDLGRVKLRFFWDRSGVGDDKSSRWVRTLQMNLVSPQVLPRIGWEVPVIYEDGNPDRPFVLGRLYNGAAPTPYGMPGKKAVSTFQSATSPSNGSTHELRLSDDAGSEEAFIHATKDQTVLVGGSHTVKVSGDRTDDVQKTQTLKIDGSQSATVSGNQSVTVGADGIVAVKGGRTESVGGNENVTVTGTYTVVSKGAYAELVAAMYRLRCNQSNATIQGAFTQVIGAALSTTAGLGSNQSVAGARTEVVGGARSYAAAAAYADGTTGVKRITAGAAKENAGGDMAFNAAARMTLQAGGAMNIQGGGKVVFEAANITVKAATLTAKGGSTMKLSGALKSSSTVKCDAPTTKKNGKVQVEG